MRDDDGYHLPDRIRWNSDRLVASRLTLTALPVLITGLLLTWLLSAACDNSAPESPAATATPPVGAGTLEVATDQVKGAVLSVTADAIEVETSGGPVAVRVIPSTRVWEGEWMDASTAADIVPGDFVYITLLPGDPPAAGQITVNIVNFIGDVAGLTTDGETTEFQLTDSRIGLTTTVVADARTEVVPEPPQTAPLTGLDLAEIGLARAQVIGVRISEGDERIRATRIWVITLPVPASSPAVP